MSKPKYHFICTDEYVFEMTCIRLYKESGGTFTEQYFCAQRAKNFSAAKIKANIPKKDIIEHVATYDYKGNLVLYDINSDVFK